MKRFVKILAITLLIVCLYTIQLYAFSVNVQSDKTRTNASDEVIVSIKTDTDVVATNFVLEYDRSLFEFVKGININAAENNGKLSCIYADITGVGTKEFQIQFRTKAASSDTNSTFKITEYKFRTVNSSESYIEGNIDSIVDSITVEVVKANGQTAVPSTTAPATTAPVPSTTAPVPGTTAPVPSTTAPVPSTTAPIPNTSTPSVPPATVTNTPRPSTPVPTANTNPNDNRANQNIPYTGVGGIVLGVAIIIAVGLAVFFRVKLNKYKGLFIFLLVFSAIVIGGNSNVFAADTDLNVDYNNTAIVGKEYVTVLLSNSDTDRKITASEVMSKSNVISAIKNKAGSNIGNNDNVATGYTAVVNGKEYKIVLYGDANGDGIICDSDDTMEIIDHYLGKKVLENEYKVAANLANRDSVLDIDDLMQMIDRFLNKLQTCLVTNYTANPTFPVVTPSENPTTKPSSDPTTTPSNNPTASTDPISENMINVNIGVEDYYTYEKLGGVKYTVMLDNTVLHDQNGNDYFTSDANGEIKTAFKAEIGTKVIKIFEKERTDGANEARSILITLNITEIEGTQIGGSVKISMTGMYCKEMANESGEMKKVLLNRNGEVKVIILRKAENLSGFKAGSYEYEYEYDDNDLSKIYEGHWKATLPVSITNEDYTIQYSIDGAEYKDVEGMNVTIEIPESASTVSVRAIDKTTGDYVESGTYNYEHRICGEKVIYTKNGVSTESYNLIIGTAAKNKVVFKLDESDTWYTLNTATVPLLQCNLGDIIYSAILDENGNVISAKKSVIVNKQKDGVTIYHEDEVITVGKITNILVYGETQTTAPAPSTTVPASSTTAPVPSTTAPAPSTTAPAPSTTAPVPSTTAPVPSTTAPAPSTTAPVPSTTAPAPSTTAPVPSTTEPVPSTTAPVPSTTEPVPSTTAPAPSTTAPAPSTTAPVPTSTPENTEGTVFRFEIGNEDKDDETSKISGVKYKVTVDEKEINYPDGKSYLESNADGIISFDQLCAKNTTTTIKLYQFEAKDGYSFVEGSITIPVTITEVEENNTITIHYAEEFRTTNFSMKQLANGKIHQFYKTETPKRIAAIVLHEKVEEESGFSCGSLYSKWKPETSQWENTVNASITNDKYQVYYRFENSTNKNILENMSETINVPDDVEIVEIGTVNKATGKEKDKIIFNINEKYSSGYNTVNSETKYYLVYGVSPNYRAAYRRENETTWYTGEGSTVIIDNLNKGDVVYTAVWDKNNGNKVIKEKKVTILYNDNKSILKEESHVAGNSIDSLTNTFNGIFSGESREFLIWNEIGTLPSGDYFTKDNGGVVKLAGETYITVGPGIYMTSDHSDLFRQYGYTDFDPEDINSVFPRDITMRVYNRLVYDFTRRVAIVLGNYQLSQKEMEALIISAYQRGTGSTSTLNNVISAIKEGKRGNDLARVWIDVSLVSDKYKNGVRNRRYREWYLFTNKTYIYDNCPSEYIFDATPVPSTTAPVPSTTEPVPSTTAPVTSTTAPVPSTTAPVPSTTEPVPSTTAPVTSTTAPVTSTTAPATEEPEMPTEPPETPTPEVPQSVLATFTVGNEDIDNENIKLNGIKYKLIVDEKEVPSSNSDGLYESNSDGNVVFNVECQKEYTTVIQLVMISTREGYTFNEGATITFTMEMNDKLGVHFSSGSTYLTRKVVSVDENGKKDYSTLQYDDSGIKVTTTVQHSKVENQSGFTCGKPQSIWNEETKEWTTTVEASIENVDYKLYYKFDGGDRQEINYLLSKKIQIPENVAVVEIGAINKNTGIVKEEDSVQLKNDFRCSSYWSGSTGSTGTLVVGTAPGNKIAYRKDGETEWFTKTGTTIFVDDLPERYTVYTAILDNNDNVLYEYKVTAVPVTISYEPVTPIENITNPTNVPIRLFEVAKVGDYVYYDPTLGVTDVNLLNYTSPFGELIVDDSDGNRVVKHIEQYLQCEYNDAYKLIDDYGHVDLSGFNVIEDKFGNGSSEKTYTATESENMWRVLKNDMGTMKLVPVTPVGDGTSYRGMLGLKNAEDDLNNISSIYGHGAGAAQARSITIADLDNITKTERRMSNCTIAGRQWSCLKDTDHFFEDNEMLTDAQRSMIFNGRYYIATNAIEENTSSQQVDIGVLYMRSQGFMCANVIQMYVVRPTQNYAGKSAQSGGVMPVVTMQKGLNIVEGNGTEESPYKYSVVTTTPTSPVTTVPATEEPEMPTEAPETPTPEVPQTIPATITVGNEDMEDETVKLNGIKYKLIVDDKEVPSSNSDGLYESNSAGNVVINLGCKKEDTTIVQLLLVSTKEGYNIPSGAKVTFTIEIDDGGGLSFYSGATALSRKVVEIGENGKKYSTLSYDESGIKIGTTILHSKVEADPGFSSAGASTFWDSTAGKWKIIIPASITNDNFKLYYIFDNGAMVILNEKNADIQIPENVEIIEIGAVNSTSGNVATRVTYNNAERYSYAVNISVGGTKYQLFVGTTPSYKIAYKKGNDSTWYTKAGTTISIDDLNQGDIVYIAILKNDNSVYKESKITIMENTISKDSVKPFDTIESLTQITN